MIALLVGETWAQSVTPLNILSGFKKSGVSPLNPSEVNDRMLALSMASNPNSEIVSSTPTPTFSADQISLYEQRFREGFDLHVSARPPVRAVVEGEPPWVI